MKRIIENFVKKYPVTFVSIILMAVAAVVSYEKVGFGEYENNLVNRVIMGTTLMFISVVECSFLTSNIFDVYNEKLPEKIKESNLFKNLIGAVLGIAIYFITSLLVSVYIGNGYDGQYVPYPVSFIFMSLACYFIITKRDMDTARYGQKVFINELILLILPPSPRPLSHCPRYAQRGRGKTKFRRSQCACCATSTVLQQSQFCLSIFGAPASQAGV